MENQKVLILSQAVLDPLISILSRLKLEYILIPKLLASLKKLSDLEEVATEVLDHLQKLPSSLGHVILYFDKENSEDVDNLLEEMNYLARKRFLQKLKHSA